MSTREPWRQHTGTGIATFIRLSSLSWSRARARALRLISANKPLAWWLTCSLARSPLAASLSLPNQDSQYRHLQLRRAKVQASYVSSSQCRLCSALTAASDAANQARAWTEADSSSQGAGDIESHLEGSLTSALSFLWAPNCCRCCCCWRRRCLAHLRNCFPSPSLSKLLRRLAGWLIDGVITQQTSSARAQTLILAVTKNTSQQRAAPNNGH